ncbi:MAG: hypothetical protein M5U26_23800 [Planctomycetota bacterium]|nr:hypothetical protein [Planctomycetota bacterium]
MGHRRAGGWTLLESAVALFIALALGLLVASALGVFVRRPLAEEAAWTLAKALREARCRAIAERAEVRPFVFRNADGSPGMAFGYRAFAFLGTLPPEARGGPWTFPAGADRAGWRLLVERLPPEAWSRGAYLYLTAPRADHASEPGAGRELVWVTLHEPPTPGRPVPLGVEVHLRGINGTPCARFDPETCGPEGATGWLVPFGAPPPHGLQQEEAGQLELDAYRLPASVALDWIRAGDGDGPVCAARETLEPEARQFEARPFEPLFLPDGSVRFEDSDDAGEPPRDWRALRVFELERGHACYVVVWADGTVKVTRQLPPRRAERGPDGSVKTPITGGGKYE